MEEQGRERGRKRVFVLGLVVMAAVIFVSFGATARSPETRGVHQERDFSSSVPEVPEIDYILVEKGKRRMSLWSQGIVVRTYEIRLGRVPDGPKRQQGDGKTPEGRYVIDGRNAKSVFHLSLHISYPNQDDLLHAAEGGVNPGSAIVIHGLPKGTNPDWMRRVHQTTDWTEGCIAVTNQEIEELWDYVVDGTVIDIHP